MALVVERWFMCCSSRVGRTAIRSPRNTCMVLLAVVASLLNVTHTSSSGTGPRVVRMFPDEAPILGDQGS